MQFRYITLPNVKSWPNAAGFCLVAVTIFSDFGFQVPRMHGASLTLAGAPSVTNSQLHLPLSLDYEEPKHLKGAIYAEGTATNALLFRFTRVATRSGAMLDVLRNYTYPDGKFAAREHLVYEGNDLTLYELDQTQTGATGSARIRRPQKPAKASIEFTYTAAGEKPKTSTETLAENTLVNDMVGPFLLSHWDALMRGQKVKCRFIVVPRRETLGLTLSKVSETKWQDREVVLVRMEATSSIIGLLLDPLDFTIEKNPPHRVLQYTGRTTPLTQVGSKWKDLDAVTVFEWE
jgi:hypothetical protein